VAAADLRNSAASPLLLVRVHAKVAQGVANVRRVAAKQQRRPQRHVDDAPAFLGLEAEIVGCEIRDIRPAEQRSRRLPDDVQRRHQHDVA
jgi:hypothetical protein